MSKQQKAKHYFFLNPYKEAGFTRCPKCDNKTKLKKFPLAVHIEPRHFLVLGLTGKYCPYCDLIITKKEKLESLMTALFEKKDPRVIGNEYIIFGTLEYPIWRKGLTQPLQTNEAIKFIHPFKNILDFKPRRWAPSE